MTTNMDFLLSAVVFKITFISIVMGQGCSNGTTATYVKRNLYRPRDYGLVSLYNSTNPSNTSSNGTSITAGCINSCTQHGAVHCPAFLLDYDASACFRINASTFDNETLSQFGLSPSGNVNYFQRACLQVPANCTSQLWPLEVSLGYELVGFAKKTVHEVKDLLGCGQLCLSETSFDCLSAGFYSISPQNPNGTCILHAEDRRTKPDAYRASLYNVMYLENQCHPVSNTCPMNDYQNSSLVGFADVTFKNITISDCESKCLSTTLFTCRGFDYTSGGANGTSAGSQCLLHGDDSYSLGPGSIATVPNSVYRERVFCLDLLVSCASNKLSMTLTTPQPFTGRIFVIGYPESCNVDGSGSNETSLVLALDPGFPSQPCGVTVDRTPGVFDSFRSVTAVIQIQYNSIIQRRGDRVVRVACNLPDGPPPELTLHKNITFPVDTGLNGLVNITVNATTILPNVRLRIVDLASGTTDTNQTVVGKALQIRIENTTPNGTFDVSPNMLTATNADGTQSFLLLDSRGCPANAEYFPGFQRDENGSYAADFSAFRFPSSPVVRFLLMVTLCENICAPPNCNNRNEAFRSRRDWSAASIDETGYSEADGYSEGIPLEFDLVVLPSVQSEPIILARNVDDSASIPATNAGANPMDYGAYFCLPNNTALGVIIGWILLQVVILLVCAFLVRYQLNNQDKRLTQSLHQDLLDYDNNRLRGQGQWSRNVEVIPPERRDSMTSSRHDLGQASTSKMTTSNYL